MRTWVIGSSVDCDVVVDSPLVSARHCQLTYGPEGYVLKDLGSTNGTYVNGLGIAAPKGLNPGDSITLARTVSFTWPREVTTSTRIGRLPDNDIVLDDGTVSGHHVRLIAVAGIQTLIEDLGSSNGTYLNSTARRVSSPTPISESDTLYFGALAVPAARLLAGLGGANAGARRPASTTDIGRPPRVPADATSAVPARGGLPWLPLCLLAKAPVFALLTVAIFGRAPVAASTTLSASVGQAVASITFALALAAVCLGGSLGVGELAAGRVPGRPTGIDPAVVFAGLCSRLALLASLSAIGCALMLAIVYLGSGLAGPWLAMWLVMVLASLAALFFGLSVAGLVRGQAAAATVLVAWLVAMTVLGGRVWPLSHMFPPVRQLAQFMPSRWAFEGLFLLETAQRSGAVAAAGRDAARSRDLAEDLFPAASERMGSRTDALALVAIMIWLAGVAIFIWGRPRASA